MFKQLAKAVVSLRVCAGWSEPCLFAQITLLEISYDGSSLITPISNYVVSYIHDMIQYFSKFTCTLSENSDRPEILHRLISDFIEGDKDPRIHYLVSKDRLDCEDAQADPSLRSVYM